MQVKREQRKYRNNIGVWCGKYANSNNAPHWHYDCELIYVHSGALDIFCFNNTYRVTEGQTAFIDSEVIHHIHALHENTVASIIIFDYELIKPISRGLTLLSPLLSHDHGYIDLYENLNAELIGKKVLYEHIVELSVAMFMAKVFRQERTVPKKKNVDMAKSLKQLLADIDEKYEFYDLDRAASFMSMNPSYFSRLFHKLTGITFSHYLNLVRIERAVELLKNGVDFTMTQIAMSCGFGTIRNFNRVFKRFTGFAPKKLPRDFELKDSFVWLGDGHLDPTADDCKLLSSSDDEPEKDK